MAARLQYSAGGFDRALMMSSVQLMAIVEGDSDVLFYERLLCDLKVVHGFNYQVRTPKEVKEVADGKVAVLTIFERLRARKQLLGSTTRKKWVVCFVDRDYDGFSRGMLRSPHLIYTPGVCMENAAYAAGDLIGSVESIVGREIDPQRVSFSDFSAFERRCATEWIDWLVYCVACEISGVAPRKNRGGPSVLHVGHPQKVRLDKLEALRVEFGAAVGCEVKASDYYRRATELVHHEIGKGRINRVFCGKWFSYFIKAEMERSDGRAALKASKLGKAGALLSHLLRKLKTESEPVRYFTSRIEALLAL